MRFLAILTVFGLVSAGCRTRPKTGPPASGYDRQLGGHVQTREVSPLKRAAVSSLHAGQGCFFHTGPTIHSLAVGPGFLPR